MKKVRSMNDIAAMVGVSESTVSRALNNSPLISESVRKKIQQIAAEHHYSPNRNARSLSMKTAHAIAVVINQDEDDSEDISVQMFTLQMLATLAEELAANKLEMLLSTGRSIRESWYDYFIRAKRADGLIVLGPGSTEAHFEDLSRQRAPFVVWEGRHSSQSYCVVSGDNRQGGFLATQHLLLSAKRQRILLLGPYHNVVGELRYKGYLDALAQYALPVQDSLLVRCGFSIDGGYKALMEYIASNGLNFDAIFAISDTIAFGAMKALREHAISVPDTVAVVGFDDVPSAEIASPSLSSVRQDSHDAARLLVKRVLSAIKGERPRSITLSTRLIVRESSLCKR